MRRTRIALILSVMLMGTTALRAQTAHTQSCAGCGSQSCQNCQLGSGCGTCGAGCGLLSGFKANLHHALSAILPGSIGSDARHKVYKAALLRNTFDKKYLLPVAYYSHLLPIYRHNRCCSGGMTTNCPSCGPQGAMGEEVIQMLEVPDGTPIEPTPAVEPASRIVPGAVVPPKEARERAWNGHSLSRTRKSRQQRATRGRAKQATPDRVARQDRSNVTTTSTLHTFAPEVLRPPTPRKEAPVRQVSAVRERSEPEPVNPLR